MKGRQKYIPALRFHWLTPLYDPLLKWGMKEEIFRRRLIERADIRAGERLLDLGCGTGTLTIMIKQSHPCAHVVGLDPDPQVLAIAREKAGRTGAQVTWDEGLADRLPYPDSSFERVVSSLVVHHLATETKHRTMREVHRVLKVGGAFHILDFGPPHNRSMRLVSRLVGMFEQVHDNLGGKLPTILEEAGFTDVAEVENFATIVGPLSLYRAIKSLDG